MRGVSELFHIRNIKTWKERLNVPKRLIHTYLYQGEIGLDGMNLESVSYIFTFKQLSFFNILGNVKGHPAVILKSHGYSRQT